ncbi:MAG TPA: hypothetical protein VLA21_09575, partial [Candidatus Limnocylindria bacterium]|nr:hypothetical protein [Candidatus Limnocylindria bacterium]
MRPSSMEAYFSTPRPLNFLLALGAGLAVALVWLFIQTRRRGLPLPAVLMLLGLSVVLGGFLSRLEYLLVESPYIEEWPSVFFAPRGIREFGFMGAVAGVLLSVWVTQKVHRLRGLGNAIDLPGLLAVFFARAAEVFVPIGTGPYVD